MAIGEAAAGAVGGLFDAMINLYKVNKDVSNRRDASSSISAWNNGANNLLDKYYKDNIRMSGDEDYSTYQRMKSGYDPNRYIYDEASDSDPNKVTFNKDDYSVEKYLNPYMDQVFNDVARTLQHTAAGSAMGRSSGAVDMVNSSVASKSAELYNDAMRQMQSERSFDYGMYTDYIKQQQEKLNNMQNGYLQQMNMLSDDLKFDQNTTDNYLSNKIALGNANMQARASLV